MPLWDDYLAHLREKESTDSNRSEFLKHISIVSLAGLGFILIEIRPGEGPVSGGVLLFLWSLSAGGFLLTTVFVILMFYLASMRAETLSYICDPRASRATKRDYLAKMDRLEKISTNLSIAISFAFTIALISAILPIIGKWFL